MVLTHYVCQMAYEGDMDAVKAYGRQDRVVTFLCKLGDNGVVWKILEFWQATR